MTIKNKQRNGSTLLIVILIMSLVMILSVSALSAVSSQKPMNINYSNQLDGIHFAEAGLNEVLAKINKNEFSSLEFNKKIDFGRGEYILDLIDGAENDGYMIVRGTGYLKNNPSTKRTIESIIGKRTFTQHVWLTNSEGTAWTATGHIWNGPFHTNGNLRIGGTPTFMGPVTYGGAIETTTSFGTVNPDYRMGLPRGGVRYDFPTSNSQLKDRAIANGHYYNGMTTIFLKDDKYDVHYFDFRTGAMEWKFESNKPLPPNGVIYVNGFENAQWDRRTGDLYVSGRLKGELTIASANDIYITGYNPTNFDRDNLGPSTGGITYTDNGKDILGLIANRNIEILSNGWPSRNGPSNLDNRHTNRANPAINNIKLYGAFFALNGSFKYNYDYNNPTTGRDKGTAELFGSLVQKTRAAWRSGSNGYNRNFTHDSKMQYKTPPFFLEPTNSGWEIKEWREVNNHVTLP